MAQSDNERLDERDDAVWADYTVRSMSQSQIARKYGLSQQHVSRIIAHVREQLPERSKEDIVARRLEQIDSVVQAVLPIAQDADKDSIASFAKLLDREAKYLGLDAPQEVRATVTQTSPEVLERIRRAKAQDG